MAEPKTRPSSKSVTAFLNGIEDSQRRADCKALAAMMRRATGAKSAMWGQSMVGYGSYDYQYPSGRAGRWFLCGFSPRKKTLVVYIMPGFSAFSGLVKNLGKYKTGKSCLYIQRLTDVDAAVLEQLIVESVSYMRQKYCE